VQIALSIGAASKGSAARAAFASPPLAFEPDQWTLEPAPHGGAADLTILTLPGSASSAITAIEHRIEGGDWVGLPTTAPGRSRLRDLPARTLRVELRAISAAGAGGVGEAKTVTVAAPAVANQTLAFGALTTPGHGAAALAADGPVVSVEKTGRGTAADLVAIVDNKVVLLDAPVDGADVELLVNDATTITATLSVVSGARSVASVAEMQAAFQASAYGDHILLRTGDYGFARNLANTTISLGWASRPDWDDPNVTLHAGDPETDGDIVIRPHDGASPRIWQLNLGRLKHVELRDLNGFCSPNNSMKGAKKAVFWGCPSPRTGRNVTLTRCTVTGLDITSPEDGKLLPSAIRFDETWPNCAYIECRVEGGCFAAVNIPGPNCRIERGIFRDAYEDVMKGGGDHTGSRVLFNVFEKSVKIGSRTEVVSVRFYGPDATQRGPNDWVDIPNGNPGPDLRKGRIVLTLPAGGVSLWQGKFDNYDGRFGFLFVPSAPAGLEAALENIPKQRNQLKYDYQTWVNWQANSRWIYRLGGDLIELEYDAETVNVNALIALGEIETPGMILQASTAHADLWQVRNSPSAVSPDNNAPPGSAVRNVDSIDTHVIGNIMVSVGFTPGGDRADNGSLNGTHDNFNPISFWKDALFCGNVVSVSGLNGLKMSRGWEALIALNTCLPDPKDPAFVRKAGGSSSSAIIINDQPDSIGNPYDPTKQILISRNITQSIGTGTTTGGVDTGDNYRPGSVMNNPAAYAAWCEDNFVRYPNFGDFATGGTFNTYAEFMQAFKPLAGSPLAGFGAHSRPDLIDHATQTYDAEGLRALIAETRATPTLSDPTAVSDAVGEVVIGVTHAKAGGVLSWSLTTSATPPAVGSIGVLGEAAGSISGDAMIAPGTRTVERTGIPSGTYYAHWRQVDHLGQASAVATSAAVTVASSGAAMELRSSYFSPATGTGSKALHTADTMSAAAGLVVLAAMVRLGASSRTLSSISVQPKDGSGNNIGSALTLAGGQVSLIGIHSATDFVRVAFHQVTLPAGTASIDVSYNWSGSVRMAFAVLTPATGWSLASSPFASNGATWGTAGGSVSVTPTAADAMLVAAAWNNGESPTLTPGDALIAVTDLNPTAGQFVGLRLATPAATAAASAASGTNSNASAAVAVLRLNTI
jgi:hypothetical protein